MGGLICGAAAMGVGWFIQNYYHSQTLINPGELAVLSQEGRRKRQEIKALEEEVEKYVRDMISYATKEGGIDHEKDISETKRRIEELNIKSRLVHGERKKAREHNDRGLRYIQSGQFTAAVQAFQEAYQADPADIEIINNLGYAHLRNSNLDTAERFLLLALVLSPGRSSAWANLGQTYAKQGNLTAAVACFANAYRFSRNKDTTHRFLQGLAKDGDDKEKEAARQVLQLKLMRGDKKEEASVGEHGTKREVAGEPLKTTGKVTHGWLRVAIQEVTLE